MVLGSTLELVCGRVFYSLGEFTGADPWSCSGPCDAPMDFLSFSSSKSCAGAGVWPDISRLPSKTILFRHKYQLAQTFLPYKIMVLPAISGKLVRPELSRNPRPRGVEHLDSRLPIDSQRWQPRSCSHTPILPMNLGI